MSRDPIRLPAFVRLDPFLGWPTIASLSKNIDEEPATGTLALGFPEAQGFNALAEPGGSLGGLTLPTGVAVDAEGVVVVADPVGGRLLRHPHPGLFQPSEPEAPPCPPGCDCENHQAEDENTPPSGFAPLWDLAGQTASPHDKSDCALPSEPGASPPPLGPFDLVKPRGVAFSSDGSLIVSDEGNDNYPGRLLVYSWPELALRHEIVLEGRPWDVAVDTKGRILVADTAESKVLRFGRNLQLQDWAGGDGVLNRPRHIVVGSDDTVLVIDSEMGGTRARLMQLDHLGKALEVLPENRRAIWQAEIWPPPIQERDGALFVPGTTCLELGRKMRDVWVDPRGRLPQGSVLLYRPRQGRRFREGTVIFGPIDGEALDFAWHRLLFDMSLDGADVLTIETYTDATALEPDRLSILPEQAWSRRTLIQQHSPCDVLVQSPPARFLWIRAKMISDGKSSPQLRAIEVLGPRQSSLQFLPAPFHEDPVGRDFLDRFLSYFDTIFDEIGAEISQFAAQISSSGVPEGAFLAWLLGWFDIQVLASWDDARRRAFLTNAMRLHRARGTVAGLRALIRLHCGLDAPMPAMLEGFRLRSIALRRAALGAHLPEDRLRIGGIPVTLPHVEGDVAHQFTVVVPSAVVPDEDARATLIRLVDAYRPAHTDWRLIVVEPGLRIGCQSSVGIDTLLGGYESAPLGEMRLGQTASTAPSRSHSLRVGDARLTSTSY